jgi:N4-gp56 family major capsid protein
MAEQLKRLFGKELQKNLFPSNEFYKNSRLDGGIEPDVKTVQIPQSGTAPTVVVNPASFPLAIGQRTDDTKEYDVEVFATLPIHIEDANEMVLNYSKRQDVVEDHAATLNTSIADYIATAWTPTVAGNISRTSGANRAATAAGTTGFRKAVTLDDLIALQEKFDRMDVPSMGRFLLVSAGMYADLLKINQFISFDYGNKKPLVDGAVGDILGMQVFKRSRTALFDASGVKNAYGDATLATDCESILAWHSSFVRRAEGNIKMYSDIDNPAYLGSIYNAMVRSGGTAGRNDQKGVLSLVQETGV